MFWSIGQFPELRTLEPHERAAVLRRVPRITYVRIVVHSLIFGAFVGGMITLATVASARLDTTAGFVMFGVALVGVAWAKYVLEMGRIRVQIRQAMERECAEESGLSGLAWEPVSLLQGPGFDVMFYAAFTQAVYQRLPTMRMAERIRRSTMPLSIVLYAVV